MTARVLVVDDVELNVKLLEAKLSSEYFQVIPAFNGPTALELAEAELPDIILLDVMMPRMDGFEVCRRLKANPRTTDIPVVMVTALSDIADRLRGLEAGADDFLTKPVNDIALFARVRSLIRLKRMMEELRLREEICGRFSQEEQSDHPEAVRGAHILLVEQQGFGASRIAETLAPIAESVRQVGSGDEAQTVLDESIELIILSLSMPDGDPLRLVSQWRAVEAFRQLPILLLADEGELPRLAKGLDLGANDYLIRPVDRNEMLARVRTQVRRKRLQDRLHENYRRSLSLALTDELTGLYNRRYVVAHIEELVARFNNDGAPETSVMMFDVDHFKQVNDQFGHPGGDDALRQLADRALRGVRSIDLVARLGGEEFVVVMPETNLHAGLTVAERLRQSVAAEPFLIHTAGERRPITISVGVAVTQPGDTVDALLQRADDALYQAKNAGRNRVVTQNGETMPARLAAAS
ncbi:MAG: PleD family two-component system response regulator [Alphaproteobacteria bacterium]|nr:PleD family two-component system response regulator [Alphaproteobacteria bacterium]